MNSQEKKRLQAEMKGNRLMDLENKPMATKGERLRGGINREFGIDTWEATTICSSKQYSSESCNSYYGNSQRSIVFILKLTYYKFLFWLIQNIMFSDTFWLPYIKSCYMEKINRTIYMKHLNLLSFKEFHQIISKFPPTFKLSSISDTIAEDKNKICHIWRDMWGLSKVFHVFITKESAQSL